MKDEGMEHKKQVDQEKITLTKQSTISLENDEEMRHAHNSSNANSSTNE
jgi:hypothetical protein